MLKMLLVIIAALLVSVAVYSGVGADSYFLLRIGDWAMQMRLFVALAILVLGFGVITMLWRLFRGIFLGKWPSDWRRRREKNLTQNAIENLALSNWTLARKELVKVANKTDKPVPFMMLSAQVSEAMGDLSEAKEIYSKTLVESPDWSYTARKRLCQIALLEGDIKAAEELFVELKKERKSDPQLFLLETRLAEETSNWGELKTLLITARKKPELYSKVASMERRFIQSRLHQRLGAPELLEVYDFVSRTDNITSDIVGQLSQQLAMRGQNKEAELLIRKALNKNWDDSLVGIYAEVEAQSPKKQLKSAEQWLAGREGSEVLLIALQKLSVRAGNDAKAEEYANRLEGRLSQEKFVQLPAPPT